MYVLAIAYTACTGDVGGRDVVGIYSNFLFSASILGISTKALI